MQIPFKILKEEVVFFGLWKGSHYYKNSYDHMIIIIVKVTITVLGNINVFNTQIITPHSVGRKQKQNLNKKCLSFINFI